jgi:hypothetical protein
VSEAVAIFSRRLTGLSEAAMLEQIANNTSEPRVAAFE